MLFFEAHAQLFINPRLVTTIKLNPGGNAIQFCYGPTDYDLLILADAQAVEDMNKAFQDFCNNKSFTG